MELDACSASLRYQLDISAVTLTRLFVDGLGNDKQHHIFYAICGMQTTTIQKCLADPEDDEHFGNWNWHGGPFDAKGFDVNTTNARIRRLR